jgi:hypothetical protein
MAKKTAYAHAMEDERRRKKERDPKRRQARRKREGALCGAKKREGGTCGHPAGWGTEHVGFGACRVHGGSVPSHLASAAKKKAILMGAPKEINPLDALIWCIKLTAGEVEFCTQQLEILKQEEWLEHTLVGKQIHVWARERQKAVDRLAKFSKDALALGIAERAVRLAEQYGNSIARYTKGLLDDLQLTPDQQKLAPVIVRKHLALLEGNAPVTDEDRRQLPAIPARVA